MTESYANTKKRELIERYIAPPSLTMPRVQTILNTPVIMNHRMRSVAGRARLSRSTIELNVRLLQDHPIEEFENTLIHEVAHLLVFALYGARGHGTHWKAMMRRMGAEPTRCHTLPVDHLRRTRPIAGVAFCECRGEIPIKAVRYRNMLKGINYICKHCKVRLTLHDAPEEE